MKERKNREMNLGCSNFLPGKFKQLLQAVPFETSYSKERLGMMQTHSGAINSETRSLASSRNGGIITSSQGLKRNYPAFEPARKPVGSIGWSANPQTSKGLNKPPPQIPKPTVKWLDLAKQSNFINYLQTKNNEINHQRQDYDHPQMFYLTNNASSVRNFLPE